MLKFKHLVNSRSHLLLVGTLGCVGVGIVLIVLFFVPRRGEDPRPAKPEAVAEKGPDAMVRTLPADIGPEVLSALITPQGSEVVDVASLERRASVGDEPARRMAAGSTPKSAADEQKLKRLSLAFLNYHDTFRQFPPSDNAKFRDDTGKPHLSWRVHVLGFVDQQPLFDKFRLDEPWDSPNNIALIDLMPDVFRCSEDSADSTTTRFLLLTGPHGLYQGTRSPSMRDMVDGTSNTILLIRSGQDKAVPWTKPDDIPLDPALPRESIGVQPDEEILVVFVDGAVRNLPSDVSDEALCALASREGGENVNRDDLQRPASSSATPRKTTPYRRPTVPAKLSPNPRYPPGRATGCEGFSAILLFVPSARPASRGNP
jgi:hypothetical protein